MSPAESSTLRIALVLVLLSASPLCAHAQDASRPSTGTASQHVRCLDAWAERLLSAAREQSPTVAALAERLDATDVAVYVTTTAPATRVSGMPRGTTALLSATASARYLQVWIDVRRPESERVAVLGHELQHTLEVAADASVRNADGLAKLFECLGAESGGGARRATTRRFETAMAQNVEARVLAEVAAWHR
jgi:hypothetical protein